MRHFKVRLILAATSGTMALAGALAGCAAGGDGASETEGRTSSASLVAPRAAAPRGLASSASCADKVAAVLSADITPPTLGTVNLGSSGGVTFAQTQLDGCETYREPQNDPNPSDPGLRYATFGDTSNPVTLAYNEESHVIAQLVLSGPSVTGTLSFHSRKGGAYGDGHQYVLALGPGAGSVTKDGVDFPASWGYVITKKGEYKASAWANEIYDGILATFDPGMAPAANGDCLTSTFTFDGTGLEVPNSPECLFDPSDGAGSSYLGVRPLHFYMVFAQGTNQATLVYEDAPAGQPSCSTPGAAIERMDFSPIYWGVNYSATTGYGTDIGDLMISEAVSNAAGLTVSEANTLEGCAGVQAQAPDPGYGATAWGPSGEVVYEYNLQTGVGYKVVARDGYKGSLTMSQALSDGGTASYVVAPGTLTLNDTPVTIDWTSVGSASKAITPISNAFLSYYIGLKGESRDCVKAGDCSIVLDDGHGNATFTLQPSASKVGPSLGLTVVFPNQTSVPSEVQSTNPGGQ